MFGLESVGFDQAIWQHASTNKNRILYFVIRLNFFAFIFLTLSGMSLSPVQTVANYFRL